jgi:hypothetical protein
LRSRLGPQVDLSCTARAASRCLAWLAIVVVATSGCGGKTVAKSHVSSQRRVTPRAPAYRVGQYCLPSADSKYRAFGLTCGHHHLAKR